MKWSQFILKCNYKNKTILLNTLNKGIVEFEDKEFKKIDIFLTNYNNISNELPENINQLIDMEFIESNECDDKLKFYDNISMIYNNDKFDLTVLPTTDCNFACKYCYENEIFRKLYFEEKDVNNIIEIIENYYINKPFKTLELCIFGGEPTLNWNFTEYLLNQIDSMCNRYGIILMTEIITNGYLFTCEKINLLLKHNLNSVQITLDGTEVTHNKKRYLRNGDGTFDKIINNVEYLLKSNIDTVILRLNYDKNNVDSIVDLIYFLEEKFDAFKEKIILSFGLLENIDIKNTNDNNFIEDIEEIKKKIYIVL